MAGKWGRGGGGGGGGRCRFPNYEVKGSTPGSLAVLAKPMSKHDRHWRIHQIQKLEDMTREGSRQTKALNFRIIRDGWMDKTEINIADNKINAMKDEFFFVQEQRLEERRQRLRDLLQGENQAYLQDVHMLQETKKQREDQLLEKAKQIRERNIARHLEKIRPLLDAQFTMSCPEVREGMVKHAALKVARECQANVAYKYEQLEMERHYEDYYDRLLKQDFKQKVAREEEEVRQVERLAKERRDGLLQQLDANEAKKKQEQQDKKIDHEAITQLMEAHRESLRVEREHKKRRQGQMRRALDRHCQLRALIKERSKEEEDAINAVMLEKAKREQEMAVTDEQSNKRQNAKEYLQFLAYIKNEAKQERNQVREEELRMVENMKKEAQQQLEREKQEAKERIDLERKVKALQLEQIREKEKAKLQEKGGKELEKKEVVLRCERDFLMEEQKVVKRKEAAMKHRRELEQQIVFRAQQRQVVEEAKKKELEAMKVAEQQYRERSQELLRRPSPVNRHPMRYIFDSQRFAFQSERPYNLEYLNEGTQSPKPSP